LFATSKRFIVAWLWRPRFPLNLLHYYFGPAFIVTMLKARRLERFSPDDILNDNRHNFAMPFSDVRESGNTSSS